VTDAGELTAQVQGMIALARALACRGAIDESLERNAASDPEPGVRLRNLVALQERARGEVGAQRASETALGDADAAVRLAGAVFLGRAGVDAAVAIAETDGVADATRIGALRHVLAHTPPDRALELARRLADTTTGEVRRAAVAVLGSAQDRASTARLIRIAREDTEAPTLFAVAKALAEIGDPAAEPALVRLLAHDAPDVATAAARSLAFVGSAAAVEPLRKCIGEAFVEPLRDTARDAIRAIQSRLVGAEAGQLSMSSTSGVEGELSLADDQEAGKLSLPERQRRREGESA
jgi:HEAT repeat protein